MKSRGHGNNEPSETVHDSWMVIIVTNHYSTLFVVVKITDGLYV